MILRSELKMECCHHSTSSSAADDRRSKNLEIKLGDQISETSKKAVTAAYYKMENPFIRPCQSENEYQDHQSTVDHSVIFANPSPSSARISKAATENDVNRFNNYFFKFLIKSSCRRFSTAAVESQFAESIQSTGASSETMSAAAIP
uniref:Uncharacterized protein n=1 Tax=Romanomermis culicivorax TaxID=13658 RepID=A0A915L9C5_ROMCU